MRMVKWLLYTDDYTNELAIIAKLNVNKLEYLQEGAQSLK